ncbi:hypothetical protein ACH5RR_039208 [Cinchona calisaya]|uniref:Uncharacterized protein n=1 Tax=Cinchona calisaya TaxID=153742 RepID=A0ABD2Y1P3_9GENT
MSRFQSFLALASTMHAKQHVDIFMARLSNSIHLDVEIPHLTDLVSAMSLARTFERKLQYNEGKCHSYNGTTSRQTQNITGKEEEAAVQKKTEPGFRKTKVASKKRDASSDDKTGTSHPTHGSRKKITMAFASTKKSPEAASHVIYKTLMGSLKNDIVTSQIESQESLKDKYIPY